MNKSNNKINLVVLFSIILFLITPIKANAQELKQGQVSGIGCDQLNGEILMSQIINDKSWCCRSVKSICDDSSKISTIEELKSGSNTCQTKLTVFPAPRGGNVACTYSYLDKNGVKQYLPEIIAKEASFERLSCPATQCTDYLKTSLGDVKRCYNGGSYLDVGHRIYSGGSGVTPVDKPYVAFGYQYECCIDKNGLPIWELKNENSVGIQCTRKNDIKKDLTVTNFFINSTNILVKSSDEICKEDSRSFIKGDPNNITKEQQEEIDKNYKLCCSCLSCSTASPLDDPKTTTQNVWTGIGCISTSNSGLYTSMLRIFIGIFGVIMLLRLIQAGYLYQFGEPEKIKESKEIIISVVLAVFIGGAGLVILTFFGIDVLGLGYLLPTGTLPVFGG